MEYSEEFPFSKQKFSIPYKLKKKEEIEYEEINYTVT